MKRYDYIIINAFTTSKYGGNPAGIVFLEPSRHLPDDVPIGSDILGYYPSDEILQSIASKLGLPMTAFLVPTQPTSDYSSDSPSGDLNGKSPERSSGKGRTDQYLLRWFNPASEVFLCGHALMALSHHLFSNYPLSSRTQDDSASATTTRGQERGRLSFQTVKYGKVESMEVVDPWGEGYIVGIDFPELKSFETLDITSTEGGRGHDILRSLRVAIEQKAGWQDQIVCLKESNGFILVELDTDVDLGSLIVDGEAFADLDPKYVVLFQVAKNNGERDQPHVHSRIIGTGKGFRVEDSATGSAHCAVIPHMLTDGYSRLLLAQHKIESFGMDGDMNHILRLKQLSQRGGDMMVCWNKGEKKVRIMGRCVEVQHGHVDI